MSALFPACNFDVTIQGGALVAGSRNHVAVKVYAPEAIPRARRLAVKFASVALATFEGQDGSYTRTHSLASLGYAIELEGITQGRHEIPLVLDLPSWIPPSTDFMRSRIDHRILFELDVDWALDVDSYRPVTVVGAPWPEPVSATPIASRSGPAFAQDLALDVTVDSTTVVEGDAVRGTLALRSGHWAPFDAVHLNVVHHGEIAFGPVLVGHRVDSMPISVSRISSQALRAGKPVPFSVPIDRAAATHQNGVFNLSCRLEISMDGASRRFPIDLRVLPRGSKVVGTGATSFGPTGLTRMEQIVEAAATKSGLRRGRWPVIAQGNEGMVDVVVADESRGSAIFAVEHQRFPSLRLELTSHPRREFRPSPTLAPPSLAHAWIVVAGEASRRLGEGPLRELVGKLLSGRAPTHLELSDRHLTCWYRIQDDGRDWEAITLEARARARAIHEAILALPIVDESFREGWKRAAEDESTFVLPHLPGLAHVRRSARTLAGEERRAVCAIAGRPAANETRVTIAFDTPIPDDALRAFGTDRVDAAMASLLRSAYSAVRVDSPQQLTLTAPGIPADPRALLDTLSMLVDWQLQVRGERAVVEPYR